MKDIQKLITHFTVERAKAYATASIARFSCEKTYHRMLGKMLAFDQIIQELTLLLKDTKA